MRPEESIEPTARMSHATEKLPSFDGLSTTASERSRIAMPIICQTESGSLRNSALKNIGIRNPHEKISEVREAKPLDIEYICSICVSKRKAANTRENQNEKADISKKLLILAEKHIKIINEAKR